MAHVSRTAGTRRRTFLKTAGAAAMALRIIPASALGADGTTPPSNRIALGLIGVGMVGQGHLRGFLHEAEAQVVAVCDVDRWRRENAQATTEQAYADRRTSGVYRGCAAYNDLRDLLARASRRGHAGYVPPPPTVLAVGGSRLAAWLMFWYPSGLGGRRLMAMKRVGPVDEQRPSVGSQAGLPRGARGER